jgi:hypothetical protein
MTKSRRQFLKSTGLGLASLPFALNLPSLCFANQTQRKQRFVVMFSPNGICPKNFWPDQLGADFNLKRILEPLAPYQKQTLVLKGISDKVRGDGDGHMRGIGCLLTGIELFPGNVQGGSHTPAGWASGISLDQELKNYLQADPARRTRFGSLEFGVLVPEKADTWTRLCYAGPNKPIAPIDDPYQMFNRLYGRAKDRAAVASILDEVRDDLAKLSKSVSTEDRRLLDEHAAFVREMEKEFTAPQANEQAHAVPELEPGIRDQNDNMPKLSKMQIDLMVNSFVNDFTRIATLQYTNSVGQAKMRWLGIDETHHELSHEPNSNEAAHEKLTKIDTWFCEQLAYLCKRLAETPEPGGPGSLLDNTTIVWTNELGQGNSHTHDNVPFVLVGGGLNFKMGQAHDFKGIAHHRLLLSIAHAFGHELKTFGNPDYCGDGALSLS